MVLFIAPTSDRSRIESVVAADPVFIYAVAEMGVTGERTASSGHAGQIVERIRAVGDTPIVFGVGISTPEQARSAADAGADGVIVGSALVRRVLDSASASEAEDALSIAVSDIVAALKA
jgi:tryptophan synthase alpha chain